MKWIKKAAAIAVERIASQNVGVASPRDWHQPKAPKQIVVKTK